MGFLNSSLFGSFLDDDDGRGRREQYLSLAPSDFVANLDTDSTTVNATLFLAGGTISSIHAPVHLPHGAVVTGMIVYGNSQLSDSQWDMQRTVHTTGSAVTVAFALINVFKKATNIYAAIDNQNYSYTISVANLLITDVCFGAVITFTD